MDDETRQQFQQMREELQESRNQFQAQIEESRNEFKAQFQSLVALVVSVKDSLERQFRSTLDEELKPIKADITTMKQALERIEARLDRQGGIIQGGTRQVARLITWSEEIDRLLAKRDERMNEFERRISNLEKPPQP